MRRLIPQKYINALKKHPVIIAVVLFVIAIVAIIAGWWFFYFDPFFPIILIVIGIILFCAGIFVLIYSFKSRSKGGYSRSNSFSGTQAIPRQNICGDTWGGRRKYVPTADLTDIDNMSGVEFESYLCSFYKAQGYSAKMTRASGDYGADLLLIKNGRKIVVQAKNSKSKVSISAVQEVIGARGHYSADEAWVVTNNYYTKPAQELAASNRVILIDRDALARQIYVQQNQENQTF